MISRCGFSRFWKFGLILPAFLLSSCSGFFQGGDTIVSLAITPSTGFILLNGTQQFTATATLGNGTNSDVTSQVTWTSSPTTVATINSSGLATGVALGTTTITATSSNNVTAPGAVLTVSNKIVTGLAINPTDPTISLSLDQTQQFSATATFSDGSTSDVTTSVTWSSGSPSVATITSAGLASPVSIGSTTIAASYANQTATADLTVTQ